MTEKNDKLRNVALVGHSGSGKTTLSEIVLYKAGIITRVGNIENGNTVMDFEPEEIKRHSSLSTSFYNFIWKHNIINLIDTPGDQNFISDTKLCMQSSDSAVLVIDSVDGVKVQTETVWEFIENFNQPCSIFINKLDKERSSFSNIVKDIKNSFSTNLLILQYPIYRDNNFIGIVDLISKKTYLSDKDGEKISINIPDDIVDEVNIAREKLVESIAEIDDNLIEMYLEGENISEDKLIHVLKKGVLSKYFTPVLCGSALVNIGIISLLKHITDIFPSPTSLKKKQGIDPKSKEIIYRKPNSTEAFSGLVFKTVNDPYAGQLSLFRVMSGKLKNDGVLYNANKDVKERYNQLLLILGKDQKNVEDIGPGSILAVSKLKETKTGDTLCDDNKKILYEPAKPFPTLISFAIEAENKGDEDKVYISLSKLLDDDSSLKLERNSETKEMLISGLGKVHIETTIEKLRRKYNVGANLKIPKIPYRETVKKKIRVQGKHKKQSGGHGQFGDCWISVEPLPRGSGFEFVDAIVGGAIPRQYIPAVEKGIIEASKKGILTGFPCVDFRATCDYGSYHAVDSSEMAFKIAGSIAFKKACEMANPVILEPVMKITITAPNEFIGDIMGDLNSRRGKVLGVENVNKNQLIKAEVPLAEIQTYAPDLRSITAGRGVYRMSFSRYDEVPNNLSKKVIDKINAYNEK